MAELQLEMVRTQEEEIEGLFETGLVDEEALLQAQEQVRHAELELMRVILDREEIRESGERPRNDIPAPLVGSRDFVTERLVLLEAIASDQMSRVERHLARYREMAAVGAIGSDDITNLNLAYQEAEAHLENLHLQLAYRQRFLSGEATGTELEHALQIAEAQNEMNLRQGALDGAVRRLQTLEERAGSGVVAEPEVRRARLEIMRMEMELDLIRLRLDDLLRSTPGDEAVAEGV
jgi:outer membrane protein TolC